MAIEEQNVLLRLQLEADNFEKELKNIKKELGGLSKSYEAAEKGAKTSFSEQGKSVISYAGNLKGVTKEYDQLLGRITGAIQSLKGFRAAMIATTTSLTAGTGALRLFLGAVFATGIGAVVIALGTLITFLTTTQKGLEFVNKSVAGLSAVFNVFVDRSAAVGEALFNIFDNGLLATVTNVREALTGVTAEISAEYDLARQLQALTDQGIKDGKLLQIQRLASTTQVKELNKIVEDTTKSYAVRRKAAQDAFKLEGDIAAKQKKLAEEGLAIQLGKAELDEAAIELIQRFRNGVIEADEAINSLGLSNSTVKDLDPLVAGFRELEQAQQASVEVQTTLQNKLNTLDKEQQAKRDKSAADAAKIAADKIKENEALQKQILEAERTLEDLRNESIEDISERVRKILETEGERAIQDFTGTEAQIAEYRNFVEQELEAAFRTLTFRDDNPLFEPTDIIGLDDRAKEEAKQEIEQSVSELNEFAGKIVADAIEKAKAGEFDRSNFFENVLGEFETDEFKAQLKKTVGEVTDVIQQINEARISGIDAEIAKNKDRIEAIKDNEEATEGELNAALEKEKTLKAERQKALEDQQRIAKISLAITTAQTVASAVQAAVALIATNPLLGVLQLVSAAAAIAGFISSVNSSIPTFHKGTSNAQPIGSHRSDNGLKPNEFYAKMERQEMVIGKEDSNIIRNLGFKHTDLASIAKKARLRPTLSATYLQPQNKELERIDKNINILVKNTTTANKYLKESDIDFNITNQGLYLATKKYQGSIHQKTRKRLRK